jgi:hypothetical protein
MFKETAIPTAPLTVHITVGRETKLCEKEAKKGLLDNLGMSTSLDNWRPLIGTEPNCTKAGELPVTLLAIPGSPFSPWSPLSPVRPFGPVELRSEPVVVTNLFASRVAELVFDVSRINIFEGQIDAIFFSETICLYFFWEFSRYRFHERVQPEI